MFKNAAKKLRVIAYITFVLCILGGLAIGFTDDSILLYILGAGGGFLVGWLSTLVMHAIVDISEKADYIIYILNSKRDEENKNNL